MTPEGAQPQQQEPQQGQGAAEAVQSLVEATGALAQGLQDAGAPPEILQLAQTASDALNKLAQMMGGNEAEGSSEGAAENTGMPS